MSDNKAPEKPKLSIKDRFLTVAELVDAIRFVPRLVLGLYAWLVYWIVSWYINFETQVVTKCDSATLNVLLREKVPLEEAKQIACSVTEVIGHPNGYTMLVSTIVGAAAVVFGLYTNSGRSWNTKKDSSQSL
ncbi:MAG: hypothetical protein JXR12_01360 [Neptunomonas phycophila]|uniref:hypothetical protein n=1 Tax=Neptunomonas phycophila TaxID=1572645 RepID=UPI003B8AA8A7